MNKLISILIFFLVSNILAQIDDYKKNCGYKNNNCFEISGYMNSEGRKMIFFLYIKDNKIERIDSVIQQNYKFDLLEITGYDLEELPEAVYKFKDIKELRISSSCNLNLTKTFENISNNFKYIKNLYLDGNNIKEIPKAIGILSSIEKLSLQHNLIEELPGEINNCKLLKEINLSGNKLLIFENIIDTLAGIDSLIGLRMDYCDLTELPNNISKLKNLNYLSVASNKITKISCVICKLKKLEYFHILLNLISEVPGCITGMKKLKLFYIGHHNLHKYEIDKLTEEMPDCTIPHFPQLNKSEWNMN
ncbi:MAG: hypothetical protein JXB17_11715 [Bacteroidales bacterium]|nr:hypothetical protein [Bacteroidales bacterium]